MSPRALALQMPIFRSREVATYLRDLIQSGLIQESEGSQWGLVTNWKHQKINRPVPVVIDVNDIKWMPQRASLLQQDSSMLKQRKDRIGKDRIGKDSASLSNAERNAEPEPPKPQAVAEDLKPKPAASPGCKFPLEEIFKAYPRRLGDQRKHAALKRLAREIKSEPDFELALEAAANYRMHCDATGKTGSEFVKQFGTWASSWREWLQVQTPLTNLRIVDAEEIQREYENAGTN
jgi:hypothetical protein